eukprot:gene11847-2387_t
METRNLQYTGYIWDGDSKSYSSIKASKHGDKVIAKIEFVGHVQKRMAAALMKLRFIGAVDGTHIPLRKPEECPTEFINRKGFYSLNVQACADYRSCSGHKWALEEEMRLPTEVRMVGNAHRQPIIKVSQFQQCDGQYKAIYGLLKNSGKLNNEVFEACKAFGIDAHKKMPKLGGVMPYEIAQGLEETRVELDELKMAAKTNKEMLNSYIAKFTYEKDTMAVTGIYPEKGTGARNQITEKTKW